MVKYQSGQLDATFGALADATRRGILEQLVGSESSVTKLAEPFNISLPAISKHLIRNSSRPRQRGICLAQVPVTNGVARPPYYHAGAGEREEAKGCGPGVGPGSWGR